MQKYSQKSIEYAVLQNIKDNYLISVGQKVVVAVSGGADSVVLLDILYKISKDEGFAVSVCHFNHRLRGKESDLDEAFVKSLCAKYSIECAVGRADAVNAFKNEEEARGARYDFFKKVLKEGGGDRVATAHTADDSAETFLLRLIRGTGISGLRSIAFRRENFIRPLLSVPRSQIEKYLKEEGLVHITDKTNSDLKYSRNFIRHKVLPLLQELNPSIVMTLFNSAKNIEDDFELLGSLVEESYRDILEVDSETSVLSRKKWLCLSPVLRRLTVRHAIDMKVGLIDITQKQLRDVCDMIEGNAPNKYKTLPHSLRVTTQSDKIILSVKK